jgi:hypothetical protein
MKNKNDKSRSEKAEERRQKKAAELEQRKEEKKELKAWNEMMARHFKAIILPFLLLFICYSCSFELKPVSTFHPNNKGNCIERKRTGNKMEKIEHIGCDCELLKQYKN